MKQRNWIDGAIHPGGLHKSLGVKQGKKLTEKQLARGIKMGGKARKQAHLAKTLARFRKR